MGARARAPIAIVVGLLVALLLVPSIASAADKYGYALKETFGSSVQPSFTQPLALAVDPATGDLLVVDVKANTISRFKRNGEPDPFSALGTNVIDGKGGADKTPQDSLNFGFGNPREVQIVVDDSGGATDGNIYATQAPSKLIDAFSPSGEYLGQITEYTSDEIQELKLTGFSQGDEFSLSGLPGSCSAASITQVPYSAILPESIQTALEARCGPSFAVKATVSIDVEYSGALAHADQPQLECRREKSLGFCSTSTLTPGDATHNEVQRLKFSGFAAGEEFRLDYGEGASSPIPSSCEKSVMPPAPYSAGLAASILATLEANCGANVATSLVATATATIEFVGAFSVVNRPQLSCAVGSGTGACAATTTEDGGQAKPLGETVGVAVDPVGALYVTTFRGSLISKYLPTSNAPFAAENVTNLARPNGGALAAGAGPTDGFLFSQQFGGEPVKLDSTTGEQKYIVDPGDSYALTVDPADGTLLGFFGENEVRQYDVSGASEAKRLAHFSFPARGIAVDPVTSDLYISRDGQAKIAVYERVTLPEAISEAASGISAAAATLHGKVSAAGGPPASCEFQYTPEATFNAKGFNGAQSAPCTPPGPFSGSSFETVSATVEGLEPGTDYRFRAVGKNKGGSVPEGATKEGALAFKTLGPAIAKEAISDITETEATLSAQLNPNSEATTYAVEYVSDAEFQKSGYNKATLLPPTPEGVGAGNKFLTISRTLSGLEPDGAYHARLFASNAGATVHGPDLRFSTYPVSGGLPDGRAWEKISPSQKSGQVIPPEPNSSLSGGCGECLPGGGNFIQPMQAASDGEAVLYEGQPFGPGLASGPNEYLSRRGEVGWDWQGLSAPTTTGLWQAFSEDLSRGILAQANPVLSAEAPTEAGKAFANLYLQAEGGAFQPLLTVSPPHRTRSDFRVRYSGANAGTEAAPAFSHVLFEANDALTAAVPGVAPTPPEVGEAKEECSVSPCNLYEWTGGQLRLVNVLSGNTTAAANSVIGSGRLLAEATALYEAPNTSHAISGDGRFVFFSSEANGRVNVRIDGTRTLSIAAPGTCKQSFELQERTCFLTASTNGKRALLSNGRIYALNEAETSYVQATDLTAGQGGFQGILGTADDLSHVYFVDTAALTPEGEANANGEHAEAGAFNLYAWQEGATAFLGILPASDKAFDTNGRYGVWHAAPSDRTAQVSPDGRYLAFMSKAALTGYDNVSRSGESCPANGNPPVCFEVFEYDAATGKLTCASCNPSGLRPLGNSNLSLLKPGLGGPPFRQPANLSPQGEGRLFFESRDALSAADENGAAADVYEYEPDGVGSCERSSGCVQLISSGKSASDSVFLDATPSGDDAFFITRSWLLPSDQDEQFDLYDARVGGGFEEEEAPVPCEAEACKGPVTNPPEVPGAGSPNFVGPGNPTPPAPCPKGKVRRGGKCVKPRGRHHRKHGRHRKRAARHNQGGRS